MSYTPVATLHHRRANPIHPRKAAHAHIRGPAKWLVLVYMAGDNDLAGAAIDDIKEMETVGSRSGDVEVVVQVARAASHDRSDGDWQGTRRYYITRGTDRRRIGSCLLADLGETNTGDREVLEEFLDFGISSYPARRAPWSCGTTAPASTFRPRCWPSPAPRRRLPPRGREPGDPAPAPHAVPHHPRAPAPARPPAGVPSGVRSRPP